jgi:hypothetical protein
MPPSLKIGSAVTTVTYVLFDSQLREAEHASLWHGEWQTTVAPVEPVRFYAKFF